VSEDNKINRRAGLLDDNMKGEPSEEEEAGKRNSQW
jgi:hypothetical protein